MTSSTSSVLLDSDLTFRHESVRFTYFRGQFKLKPLAHLQSHAAGLGNQPGSHDGARASSRRRTWYPGLYLDCWYVSVRCRPIRRRLIDRLYPRAATGPTACRPRPQPQGWPQVGRGVVRGGESIDSMHGPNFIPVAGVQHAVGNDGASASRRRRQPVERRLDSKFRLPTNERRGRTDAPNSPRWARPYAAGNLASGAD